MDTLYVVSIGHENVHMTTDEAEARKVVEDYNKALKTVKPWHTATLTLCEIPKKLVDKTFPTGITQDPWD